MLVRLLHIAVRDLAARWGRSLLTIAGIMIAIGGFTALDIVVRGFNSALDETVASTGTHAHILEKNALDFLSSVVPENLVPRIRALPIVEAAAPVLVRMIPIDKIGAVPLLGWPPGAYLWNTVTITRGRLPRPGAALEIMLGQSLADRLGLRPGDTLDLMGVAAQVVGTAETGSQINRGAAFVPLAGLQALTFRDGKATSINVRLNRDGLRDPAAALAALAAAAPGFGVFDAGTLIRDNFLVRLMHSFAWIVSLLALLITFFGMLSNVWSSVRERRHDFAILRAVGWPVRRIGLFVLFQAWIVSGLGALLGVGCGVVAAKLAGHNSVVATYIQAQARPSILLAIVAAALFAGSASVIFPLRAIARIDPGQTLKSI